jgi:hypothetical protein
MAFVSEHPGYRGAQDTFYSVAELTVGRFVLRRTWLWAERLRRLGYKYRMESDATPRIGIEIFYGEGRELS